MSQARKLLDEKGRCCGRKPIVYKRIPHLFCTRCYASFDVDTWDQIENWAWEFEGGLVKRRLKIRRLAP